MGVLYLRNIENAETAISVMNYTITRSLGQLDQISFEFVADDLGGVNELMMIPLTIVIDPDTGQEFRIQNIAQNPLGVYNSYSVNGISIGIDLHDKYVDGRLTGTQSLDDCMKFITKGTKFKYELKGSFDKYTFSDGFGGDYADSLFMGTLASNFKFEWWFDNYTIHIAKTIGSSDAFAFVDGLNASGIKRTEDYSNIQTYIKGYGKPKEQAENDKKPVEYMATADYTSPQAKLWGIKEAAAIYDERFTDKGALQNYIKNQLQDYPLVQYTVDQVVLTRDMTIKNDVKIGNSGLLKDRFGTDVDVRIISCTLHPQNPETTDTVTFGNYLYDFATMQLKQQAATKRNTKLGKSNDKRIPDLLSDVDQIKTNGLWYKSK